MRRFPCFPGRFSRQPAVCMACMMCMAVCMAVCMACMLTSELVFANLK